MEAKNTVDLVVKTKPPNSEQNDNKFGARYALNWSQKSLDCRRSTNWICCYPGCNEMAVEAHHVVYSDRHGAIAGREVIGVHIFPGCDRHVSRNRCSDKDNAHNWRNWIIDPKDPLLKNRNTTIYYKKMRDGWLQKSIRSEK